MGVKGGERPKGPKGDIQICQDKEEAIEQEILARKALINNHVPLTAWLQI